MQYTFFLLVGLEKYVVVPSEKISPTIFHFYVSECNKRWQIKMRLVQGKYPFNYIEGKLFPGNIHLTKIGNDHTWIL